MTQHDAQPWQDDAKSYMDRRDWAGAIPSLERDIVEHPSDPWSRIYLGICHSALKNFDVALSHFRDAEALAPDLSAPIGCQGDTLCSAGKWEEAGEFYRRALEMDPDSELAQKNWKWWNSEMKKT